MNTIIVPPALAALPYPWCLSDPFSARGAIKTEPRDAERRIIAGAALETCLHYLTENSHPSWEEPAGKLPEHFYEAWPLFKRNFARQMPTLGDVSYDSISHWLVEDVDLTVLFGEPLPELSPEIVEEIGRFWLHGTVRRITVNLLRWLRKSYWEMPDALEKPLLLSALKATSSRLPWQIGQEAVGVVWDLSKPDAGEFLIALANDPAAPQQTREEAARLAEHADHLTQ